MLDESYPKPTRIFTSKSLYASWRASKDARGKGGAPGIDRITADSFARSLDKHIQRIVSDANLGELKLQTLRALPIPKENGKYRVICIPTVRDRLVQRTILHNLTAKKDLLNVRHNNTFGAAKGKEQGTHAAIDEAVRRRQVKQFVLKTDISKFFDNIPRDYLIQQIKVRLRKRAVVPILEQVVRCEINVGNDKHRELIELSGIARGKGLRQGMPLSPLLSNLVLNKFDKMLVKQGKSFLRYVDDLIVFEDDEADCQETYSLVESELKKLGLSIPGVGEDNSKSEIKLPDETVDFLGLSIYKQKNGTYAKRIPQSAFDDLEKRIETEVSYEHFDGDGNAASKTFAEYSKWFNDMSRGYMAA